MRPAWTDYGRNSHRPDRFYITKLLTRKPADTLGDDGANPAPPREPVTHGAGGNGQRPRQLRLPTRAVKMFADLAEFGGGHAARLLPNRSAYSFFAFSRHLSRSFSISAMASAVS